MNKIKPINIMKKFSLFNEKWTPKIIAELNDQLVKICKLKDDFVWHSHENEDELFMVFKGTLFIDENFWCKSPVKLGNDLLLSNNSLIKVDIKKIIIKFSIKNFLKDNF